MTLVVGGVGTRMAREGNAGDRKGGVQEEKEVSEKRKFKWRMTKKGGQ